MPFKSLDAAAIEASLSGQTRQYLTGALKQPQPLSHIHDADIEVGLSDYPQSGFEPAHRHARAKEYQYVLRGMTEYQDLDTGEIHRFRAGDFYVIDPGTAYVQRIKRDTRILFFKYPGGNDKESVPMTQAVGTWARETLHVTRLDLNAREGRGAQPVPAANSLKPAVAVAVFDAAHRLLLVKRRDSGYWAMPGGTMEVTDSLEGCARREVREETGIEIMIAGMVGTYTDPETIIAYSDGEVRREFSILLAASATSENLSHDDESTDVQWVELEEVMRLPMVASQVRRIQDVLAWRENRGVFIR
ncbi:NUDIX domain-containing protein [Paraburkholderia humisilvae]|uniref:Nucleoside triphosphatase NudI n=1 Tax=Paraburkholderia humisilvae TaxID=627669 RepID=A0A6J5DGP7_9BURK|nr:NUDIX domain-containing protein [Paraburkholderia humisilvae]CAB3752056.1 Nucleoside triphosphatase NudI [Paraburkholderia humisilvae]